MKKIPTKLQSKELTQSIPSRKVVSVQSKVTVSVVLDVPVKSALAISEIEHTLLIFFFKKKMN